MMPFCRLSIVLLTFFAGIINMSSLHAQSQIRNETILLFNKNKVLPIGDLANKKIAVIHALENEFDPFIQILRNYAAITTFGTQNFTENTKFFNTIILVGSSNSFPQSVLLAAAQAASNGKDVILCTFSTTKEHMQPFAARYGGIYTELVAPDTEAATQQNMAMSLFGGISITKGSPENHTRQTRIQYANPDLSAWDIPSLTAKIDEIAHEAIREKAAPGMVVMAVKDNKVLFHKAYGHHMYTAERNMEKNHIFDLASISKIAGTTPVIMHLFEQGKIDLNKTIGDYLWEAKNTDKTAISLRTVLLHEAGFTPFIPFYRYLKPGDLQSYPSESHSVQVADGVFLRTNYYRDIMWPQMLQSPVKAPGNYVYSDISMYVLKEIAEHVSSTPMEDFVANFLYKSIGMQTSGYNPRKRFEREQIVPTQNDTSFRKTLLHGFVHDEGAAMAGGVAGHAGLFGSANDLAIFGQMLLNKGTYGGVRYFNPSTVELFTSKQSASSRRGLGFDRYDPNSKTGYPSALANSSVFGHTGYTGTCIWIDPQNQLVYIFLSNRVHPQVSAKLGELNIRSRIQDAIYETINPVKND